MTVTLILVVIAIIALGLVGWLARRQDVSALKPEELSRQLRPVDIEAFRNLIDPAETEFLRRNLAPAQFRSIQRERMCAAIDYIHGAMHNASILSQMGELARRSADASIARAGEKLVQSALQLRLQGLQAIAKLYIAVLLPNTHFSPAGVTDNYERMTRIVALLGVLRFPAQGVAAAL
jgi:hypothetical protein